MGAVIVSFLKKGLYALVANVVALLMFALAGYQPGGDSFNLQVYALVVTLLTGLVAALKRLMDKLQPPTP